MERSHAISTMFIKTFLNKRVDISFIEKLINKYLKKEEYTKDEKKSFWAYDPIANIYITCENDDSDCFIEEFKNPMCIYLYFETELSTDQIHYLDNDNEEVKKVMSKLSNNIC